MATNIEWTDETDNIIVVEGADGKQDGWWCRRCSEGCDNCYSCKLNDSDYFGGNHLDYSGPAPKLMLRSEIIASWARQRRPRRHFVASMTDVFGEWVPQEWIFEFLDGMAAAPLQTFQVLTKRARVMRTKVFAWLVARRLDRVPENIWLGVSAENQKWADIRIKDLIPIPATHFVSVEPMLDEVNLYAATPEGPGCRVAEFSALNTAFADSIHWVICGGESGPNARPMHPDWARSLRDQCVAAGVPFFFKQWGEHRHCDEMPPEEYAEAIRRDCAHVAGPGNGYLRVGKKAAGRLLDGREWSEFPKVEVPA